MSNFVKRGPYSIHEPKPKICNGRGICIIPCYCPCFDGLVYDDSECKCGHGAHNGYCPSDCCEPVECHNYRLCHNSVPQHVLDMNEGVCHLCNKNFGRLNYAELSMPCSVCTNRMEMIELPCGHLTCILCWRSNSYVECVQCTFANREETAAYSAFMDEIAHKIIIFCFLIFILLCCYISFKNVTY